MVGLGKDDKIGIKNKIAKSTIMVAKKLAPGVRAPEHKNINI